VVCLAAPAEPGGELLGYLMCARYDTVWHLMNIAVDPSQRRRGIAWALLERMIERAGPEQQYTLEVRPSNAPAITLYERLGFRAAGRRPRYYRDNGEDALIMWRTLETTSRSTASG
jgi:ribosomal-protein-alanine N-acetyltransferase